MRTLICRKYPAADGVELAADVYLPDGPGPFPVILTRTPYDRVAHLAGNAAGFVQHRYGYVATDCRGRFESGGVYERMFDEAADGQATVDWIASQPWCNGRIGMWGLSYGGGFQVPAAAGGHEAIKCLCPSVIAARFFENWSRYDGCFALLNPLWWIMQNGASRTRPPVHHIDWNAIVRLKSLDEVEQAVGMRLDMLRDMAEHDTDDAFWERINQWPMHEQIKVPAMHSGGWFDHISMGQYEAYERIRDLGATDAARQGQRLFIGPWYHLITQTGDQHRRFGTWDFGPSADVNVFDYHLRFFNLHLKEIDDGLSEEPPVRIFLMGENRWLDLPDWPPPAEQQQWHLDSNGNAHGQRGDGRLSRTAPTSTAHDRLAYDPNDPVPTWGGQIFWNMPHGGPQDQRHLLERDDMLFYQSDPLGEPLCVVGNVSVDLTIAADVDDTDLVVRLCVVEPNGAVTSILVGSFRCRYREGFDRRVPLVHGEPAHLHFRLSQVAYTFPVGSRVALTVTSSDFPRIQPHTNTMAKPWVPVEPVIANTDVLHGGGIRTHLNLPVVEGI